MLIDRKLIFSSFTDGDNHEAGEPSALLWLALLTTQEWRQMSDWRQVNYSEMERERERGRGSMSSDSLFIHREAGVRLL